MKTFVSLFILFLSFEPGSAQITLSGVINGFNNRPIPLANVCLSEPGVEQTIECVEADKNGQFLITIRSEGVWLLRFSGVFHQDYTVAIYADRPKTMYLNVRLATCQWKKEIPEVKILGNFNRWYPPTAVPMRREQNGTFAAEIKTRVDPVLYQLSGLTNGNVAGTQADRFSYDETHGYSAVLRAHNGKVRIVFDRGKLLSSDEPASFSFSKSDSVESRFANVYDQVQQWNKEYAAAFKKSVRDRKSGRKAAGFDYSGILSTIEKQIESERSNIVRQELQLQYYMFVLKEGMADSMNSRKVLREVPPGSVVWSLAPALISRALDYSMYDRTQQERYVQEVIDENSSSETISVLLTNEFMKLLYGGERERALRYYDIAVNQYGGTAGAKEVAHYHNISAVDTGKTAPAFSVRSMRNSKEILSEKLFKGKYLLMDFWATWSKPSVDEIRNLQRAYKEFGGKRFVILSLSLDSSRQVVEQFGPFRDEMPWFNAFVEEGFKSKICGDYEVFAVPKPVLVDPYGKVVAVGLDLRGDKLRKTLANFLGKHKQE